MSAVFVWDRPIMFIHYRLLYSWPHEISSLILRLFENGKKAQSSELGTHLDMIGYYSRLPGLDSSRSLARSVPILCNTIVNSSWLPHDRTEGM